jgi:hypothetical protein
MDRRDTIRTGDVLLFSNNTPTAFLLRTFVSSQWNHSGIAVRFKDILTETGIKKVVSLNEEGELYILETNTGMRRDEIFNVDIIGSGFSRASNVFNKYNKIAVRRLHDIFRTPEFADRTLEFADKNRGSRFPSSSLPFISVWLGISLNDKDLDNNEMFCSELMAHYYTYTLGPIYHRLTGGSFEGKLSNLFGAGSPNTEDMFTPGHYSSHNTPNAPIFSGTEEIIYLEYADILYVILQPFLIIVVIMLALWMALPK